jgi:hypothetical protein
MKPETHYSMRVCIDTPLELVLIAESSVLHVSPNPREISQTYPLVHICTVEINSFSDLAILLVRKHRS